MGEALVEGGGKGVSCSVIEVQAMQDCVPRSS